MIEIAKDSTGNTATFQILDSDGIPDTGVAYNAAGLAVFYTPHGGTQVAITLSSENWHEKGNGWYEVDVADAVYASVRVLDFGGVITDGHVIGERQSVVEDLYTAAGVQDAAAAAIADAGIATEAKQDEILAAIASAGVGARTCVITVDDGSTALESARVRVTKGAESWLQTTDASGQATFNLDDGTWTVAITLAGYTFSGDTLVVDGDEAETFSMTAAGFTPSVEPDSVTVRWRVMDEDGRPCGAGEGTVRIRVSVGPNVAGFAWDKSERIATTDANGYVEFPDVPAGCTLRAKLGAASAGGEWFDVTIPSDATSPYEPGEILGTVP